MKSFLRMRAVRGLPIAILGLLAALVLAPPCGAQTASSYPDKAVRIIVPFAPAGPTDVVARLIAAKLTERLGKQFYVENVAGAGGNLGMGQARLVMPSAPDDVAALHEHRTNHRVWGGGSKPAPGEAQ